MADFRRRRLPRVRPSRLVLGYGVLGLGVVAAYLAAGVLGLHFGDADKHEVPASVRSAPGGYRAYYLWHAGYQGGK